jgi:DnaJ-domain-containing protein 1
VEILGVLFMIFVGGVLAVGVMVAIGLAQRNADVNSSSTNGPDRSRIAASILFQLLLAGGSSPDEALRGVRRAGIASPVTAGIDVTTWGDRFRQLATQEQREWLLETAVQLIAAPARAVPLRQYAALLDLSFALGFQTNALAKLREQYGFDYIDHAKDGRPPEADRGGGSLPLFVRGTTDRAALLRVLGLEGSADRQAIITAYRRLAAQYHPDRVFGAPVEVQSEAAAKFIEITRAYEALMAIYRD